MSNSQSKNALTHGYYASDIVLPSENQQEFEALLQAYRNEYFPDGVSEEAAVFDLASLHWKKRRFEAGSRQALQMQRDYSAVSNTTNDGWDVIADLVRAAAKSQTEAAQRVCQQITDRVVKDETNAKSLVEFEGLNAFAKELSLVSKEVIPLLHAVEKQKLDQIDRAYYPDITEKQLKVQADYGRQIERTIKRLVLLKDLKKYYCAKPVNANQIAAS